MTEAECEEPGEGLLGGMSPANRSLFAHPVIFPMAGKLAVKIVVERGIGSSRNLPLLKH